ncbi:hypothetical protein [Actinomycetospora termitidis]|uniref:Uncharacterized protein n=1 Tax=Actinomycetospora termitidis TaxID=3053470 RepID=A0ABT7MEA5_9PSEU|nr:hypothetical protein [Actinomycetospora sp. Odt1-22]MDL5158991.1 hypothetical protein [Actinomycetospora sp. Odt1-22]
MPPIQPADDEQPTTTLWGGTSSGKSTFLWTLPLAAYEAGWMVIPVDDESRRFLDNANQSILRDQVLPTATRARRDIHWKLRRPGTRFRRTRTIDVRMTDRPGSEFQNPEPDLIEMLAGSDALVYLFDAQREFVHQDAVAFFGATMTALLSRMQHDLHPDGRLPHHLAVCVAKLDNVPMVHDARRGLWLTQDARPPFAPRVADVHARDFFEWLCRDRRARAASAIRNQILANFSPSRTHFYVTSAVGFHAPDGAVDLDDPDNLQVRGGQYVLRSTPRPVNVLEPLVDLQHAISRGRR